MLPLLFSFLSALPGVVGKYFDTKAQITLQTLQNNLAIEQEKNKLIAQGIISQAELGQTQINATSPWFKQGFYSILLAPIVITCISPEHGQAIFNSLNIVPEWYIIFVTTIGFAIWGVNSDKVQQIIEARRAYKLAKIDRKAYYENLKLQKGFVTQDDLKINEPIFDKMDSNT